MVSSTCTCGYTVSDDDYQSVDEKMRMHEKTHTKIEQNKEIDQSISL
jgi:hypothetical protein